jgi:glycosyltransferase involved in cell wall biosynthesis
VDIGLCLIVRDEAHNIASCLRPILDLIEDIVVVDTGSSDGTIEILKEQFGIRPLHHPIDRDLWFNKYEARNLAFGAIRTPWILSLDADERLNRDELKALAEDAPDPRIEGYFLGWITYADGPPLEDYKLALFRKGFRSLGFVHENVQQDIRARGCTAAWRASPVIRHYPDPTRIAFKRQFYVQRLIEAVSRDPDWYRYHWFLGYAYFREGDLGNAKRFLELASESRSRRFPVECLNAHLVLAELHARARDKAQVSTVLASARTFLAEVGTDFEVRVNFRLGPWLEEAQAACDAGRLEEISAYPFAA